MDPQVDKRRRSYEVQLRRQALRTTFATLSSVLVLTFAPVPSYVAFFTPTLRLLLTLLAAGTGAYSLAFRSKSLILDYHSLDPLPPRSTPSDPAPLACGRAQPGREKTLDPSATFPSPFPAPPAPPPDPQVPESNDSLPPPPRPGKDETDPAAFESAEWMNGIMKALWPIVDRQLMVGLVDLVEDAIKEESPGVVRSVRITDLSPGTHPIRLLGLRVLPSSPTTPFSFFHSTPHGCLVDAQRAQNDVKITSAFEDPAVPRPAPWTADGEEQGHASEPASSGGIGSPYYPSGGGEGRDDSPLPFSSARGRDPKPFVGPRRKEEALDQRVGASPSSSQEGGKGGKHPERSGDGADKGATPGPFVELEVEFGYRRGVKFEHAGGEAGEGESGKAGGGGEADDEGGLAPEDATDGMHLVTYLGLGVSKLATIPVPCLISVTHLRGAAHLRLQLVPEPPFVKTVGFGFREMPEVSIAAHPLRGPLDVMSLPLLRGYILSAVRSVLEGFVLPRHYALDIRKIIMGGDVAMKTRTVGILCLVLHRAHSLPASDPSLRSLHLLKGAKTSSSPEDERAEGGGKKEKRVKGKSDPFVDVGWAGMGKTLYKTRIVPSSLDPVWEEMCFIRVPQEPIEDGQKLRLTVMDHDRFNPNDTLGYLDLPITVFSSRPGKWERNRRVRLQKSVQRAESEERDVEGKEGERGELEFSAAYFPLVEKLDPSLLHGHKVSETDEKERTGQGNPTSTTKEEGYLIDSTLDERAKETEEEHEKNKRMRLGKLDELLHSRQPAPPSHPSGILSFQIHQIASLELPSKSPGPVKSTLRAAVKVGQTSTIRKADVPSSYVEAFVNDEEVFRTRLKPFSNAPYFNTGSEAFLRNWQEAVVSFAVMDYRDRGACSSCFLLPFSPPFTDCIYRIVNHDVLAGYVELKLAGVLKDHCQVTKWYPIVGGAGSGRLRASVLFKPLAITVPRGLREWSVGTLEILSAKVDGGSGESLGSAKLSFSVKGGGSCSTDSASAEENGFLAFDFSQEPLRLPVLSRLAPVKATLDKHHGVLKDSALEHGIFWMNDVVRGEPREMKVELTENRSLNVPNPHELPQLRTDEPSSDPPSDSPPAPSPSSPPDRVQTVSLGMPMKRTKDGTALPAALPDSSFSSPPTSLSTSNTSPSLPTSSDPRPPSPMTLTLTVRWRPGMSTSHSSLVLSASSAARASYQLFLHRSNHNAELRREKVQARKMGDGGLGGLQCGGGEGEMGKMDADDWESEEDEEEDLGGKDEINGKGELKQRKGGTLRWMAHTAKVAAHRLKQSKHHHMSDPKPESEIMSAL
ncbi:hypothetical protein JCM8547_008941 [Rhodosporidiobolus lusitaniae]